MNTFYIETDLGDVDHKEYKRIFVNSIITHELKKYIDNDRDVYPIYSEQLMKELHQACHEYAKMNLNIVNGRNHNRTFRTDIHKLLKP